MISLSDLTTPLTRDQAKQSIYDVLTAVGVNTTTWKPGAVARTIITAVAILISAFSQLTSSVARGGFLELASGAWLDLVAHYVYGVDRVLATFAPGEVTLTNTSGNVYSLDPDDLVVSNPDTGKTYRNTTAFVLNAGATLTIPIVAIEAGSASTSTPGTIVELETTLLGVTCTNALAAVGLDDELDPSLRSRCREKLGSLSPFGPWDAYTYAAKNAKRVDGTPIGVTRARTVKDGYGNVSVYVATATGAVSGVANDIATDLGAVNDAIQRRAAPLAVTADTISASPLTVPVTYEVWAYNTSGLTPAQWQSAIATALANFMSAQPVGGNVIDPDPGKIFVDGLRRAIGAVRSETFRVVVTAPAADVELSPNQVAVLGTVTVTAIHEVAPPEGF
jgi:phage-related baseplate assembly protein